MPYRLFEPTVMFFGLTNSPATFQMMMNEIYKDTIEKHEKLGTTIRVYMDDIRIATRTNLLDHTNVVKDILKVAMNYNLYFKLEKCTFHSPSLDYLGVILEKGVTCMDPVKISGQHPPKLGTYDLFLDFAIFIAYLSEDSWPSPNRSMNSQRKLSNGHGAQPNRRHLTHLNTESPASQC